MPHVYFAQPAGCTLHDSILLHYDITIVMVIMSMADTATESARQFINSIVDVYHTMYSLFIHTLLLGKTLYSICKLLHVICLELR